MAANRDLEALRELWALLEQDVDRYPPSHGLGPLAMPPGCCGSCVPYGPWSRPTIPGMTIGSFLRTSELMSGCSDTKNRFVARCVWSADFSSIGYPPRFARGWVVQRAHPRYKSSRYDRNDQSRTRDLPSQRFGHETLFIYSTDLNQVLTIPALEATQGQMDSFFSQLPYKVHLEEVASVGD